MQYILEKLSCRWDEDFELLVPDPEHEKLTCVLMNKSTFGADEEIGRIEVRRLPFASSGHYKESNAPK